MLVSVHVEKNGQALGYRQVKCESRMRELDQILRSCDNPLEFMCQVRVCLIILAYHIIQGRPWYSVNPCPTWGYSSLRIGDSE
jgi:hypothetical protein